LIYKDLTELYNYNITDKYYVGQYEGRPLKKYGNNLTDFINSGAILINLENLRKDNIFQKMIDFLRKNNQRLSFLDQDAKMLFVMEKIDFFLLIISHQESVV
jgi:lipopolysaccharide biosynthesis glycosyltransferase